MIGACIAMASVGVVLLSLALLNQPDGWLANVLIEVGATLMLFAPLLVIGKRVENRLGQVQATQQNFEKRQEQTASEIASLTEEVHQSFADLRANRDPLSDAVLTRLAAAREEDAQVFAKLDADRTRENVFEAINRAAKMGLIFERGCRVRLFDTDLFVWFETFSEEDHPDVGYFIRLEHWSGQEIALIRWEDDVTAEDFLLAISNATQSRGHYPGDDRFDPGRIFPDLHAMLEFAHNRSRRSGSSGRPLPPLVELCLPQWAVTESSIVSLDPHNWREIHMRKIYESDWHGRISGESWVDRTSFDAAFDHGKSLYELYRLAVSPHFSDEPPF